MVWVKGVFHSAKAVVSWRSSAIVSGSVTASKTITRSKVHLFRIAEVDSVK